MKSIRRFLTGGTLGTLLALSMSAAPAQAATVLYVDDMASNNGPVKCPPSPPAFADLQSAVASLGATNTNVTINICPGIYNASSSSVVFFAFKNLKVVGKGGPLINADGFSGAVIVAADSTNVTVSGLLFSGGSNLGGGGATAIEYANSTGTIKNNVVTDWHQDFNGPPLSNVAYGIETITNDASKWVSINNNTVFDVQDNGILAAGPAKAKISRNRVVLHSDIDPFQYFNPGPIEQAGILLVGAGAGSIVSGNVVESNAGMEPYPCKSPCILPNVYSRGVLLLQTSKATVSGNKISYLGAGVSVEAWCYATAPVGADQNLITKNKLYNNRVGVEVRAQDYYGSSCSPHANNTLIKSNRFDRNYSMAGSAAFFTATLPATVSGSKMTGNTLTGFPLMMVFGVSGNGASDPVQHANTVRFMPLTGPLP